MVSATTIVIGAMVALFILLLVGYIVSMYNRIVKLDKDVEKAWSNIDVLLKQRSEELPKLIDSAEEYMDYEESVLKEVTEARTKMQEASSRKEQAKADSMLENALGNLFAVAEDYPELKANESFQQLQDRISSIEEQISDRRELYNSSATNYNTLINQIPYVILANIMSKKEKELFEATEEERRDVDISEGFNSN